MPIDSMTNNQSNHPTSIAPARQAFQDHPSKKSIQRRINQLLRRIHELRGGALDAAETRIRELEQENSQLQNALKRALVVVGRLQALINKLRVRRSRTCPTNCK